MFDNLDLNIQQFSKQLEENQLPKEQNYKKTTKKINVSKLDDKEPKNRTRHPFSKKEDNLLMELVRLYDTSDKNNWYLIAYHMDGRSPRQCRERYQLFLSQGINKKVKWTKDEDDLLLSKFYISHGYIIIKILYEILDLKIADTFHGIVKIYHHHFGFDTHLLSILLFLIFQYK